MKLANVLSRWLTQGCQLSCISRETHAIDTFHTHSCHMFISLRSENKLQCLEAAYTTLQMKGQYFVLHGFDGSFWQFNTSRGMLRACPSLLSLSTGLFFFFLLPKYFIWTHSVTLFLKKQLVIKLVSYSAHQRGNQSTASLPLLLHHVHAGRWEPVTMVTVTHCVVLKHSHDSQ